MTHTPAGSSSSSSTAAGVLQPGYAADALLVWFELQAAGVAVSTGPAAATCAERAEQITNSPPHTRGSVVENSAHLLADNLQYHSTGVGMGLYYLDACIPALTADQQATVHITTTCSCTAVRPAFQIHSDPAGWTEPSPCGESPQQQQAHKLEAGASRSTALGAEPGRVAYAHSLSTNPATHSSSAGPSQQQQLGSCPSCAGSSSAGVGALHLQPAGGTECQPTWSPHGMPRHAWLPRWHFDMLADQQRNNAYQDAIR